MGMRQTKQAAFPAPSVRNDAGGGMTGNESFVTVNDDSATLPNSRQLTAGTNISVVDGGSGNPITINCTLSEVEFDRFIPADRFLGTSGDTSPAPLIWYELDTEFVGQVIYFDPDEITIASAFDAVRWPEIASYAANASILFFSDNADEQNNISWSLGYTGGTYPGGVVNNAPTYATATITAPGQWKIGRKNFTIFNPGGDINVPFTNEVINWFVRRNNDDHPGNVYFIGLLVYFERTLS